MLGMYLTTAVNFLAADTSTISGEMGFYLKWFRINYDENFKNAVYAVLLQLITFLGDM